jgi:hypothetical protein
MDAKKTQSQMKVEMRRRKADQANARHPPERPHRQTNGNQDAKGIKDNANISSAFYPR